jgi:hypothetical protein
MGRTRPELELPEVTMGYTDFANLPVQNALQTLELEALIISGINKGKIRGICV